MARRGTPALRRCWCYHYIRIRRVIPPSPVSPSPVPLRFATVVVFLFGLRCFALLSESSAIEDLQMAQNTEESSMAFSELPKEAMYFSPSAVNGNSRPDMPTPSMDRASIDTTHRYFKAIRERINSFAWTKKDNEDDMERALRSHLADSDPENGQPMEIEGDTETGLQCRPVDSDPENGPQMGRFGEISDEVKYEKDTARSLFLSVLAVVIILEGVKRAGIGPLAHVNASIFLCGISLLLGFFFYIATLAIDNGSSKFLKLAKASNLTNKILMVAAVMVYIWP